MIALAALVEAILLTWVQGQNYLGFHAALGDLGNFNQMFSTTVHGQGFFYYTINIPGGSNGTLWSVHFSPTLALLVPAYALAPTPITLLFLKQLALTMGALPVYGIAKSYFRGTRVPIVFAALYLLSPLTLMPDWNNFNPESFVPVTVLVALYFFTVGRFWPFLAAWVVALGTIESAPPLLVLFGVGGLLGTFLIRSRSPYWTARQQRKPLVAATLVAGAWFGLAYAVLSGLGRGGGYGTSYAARYQSLGATSLPGVVTRVLTDRGAALQALQYQGSEKFLFVAVVLVGSGLFWILGGLRYVLPVVGFFFLALLSNVTSEYILGSQYSSLIWPFLIVGTIEGVVLVSDFVRGMDAGARHRALAAWLTADAREVLQGLPISVPDSTERVIYVARLRRVAEAIANERLSDAETQLRRIRRQLRVPAAAFSPPVASRAPPPGAIEGPRSLTRPQRIVHYLRSRDGGLAAAPIAAIVILVVVASSVTNPLLSSPVAGGPGVAFGLEGPTFHDGQLDSVLALIPPDGSVLTSPHLFPAVSNRPDAYSIKSSLQLPTGESTEDLIVGGDGHDGILNQTDYVAEDYWIDPLYADLLQNYVTNDSLTGYPGMASFGLEAAVNGSYLYERGWTGTPELWAPWSETWAGGDLQFNRSLGSVSSDYATSNGPSLYHAPGGSPNEQLSTGPHYLYLPPGTYTATFSVVYEAENSGSQFKFEASDFPTFVNDSLNPLYIPDYSFHNLGLNATVNGTRSFSAVDLNTTKLGALISTTVSVPFRFPELGILNLPIYVESRLATLYVLSVSVVQSSTLT